MSDRTYMTTYELANRLRLTPGALANWRLKGKGPTFVKIGKRVLYPMEDILKFEDAMRRQSTAEDHVAT